MADNGHFLCATHAKSKEQLFLHVQDGQIWSVGRQDGSQRLDKWNVPFDPALSRDHFRAIVGAGKVTIEASKNRHPILFEGEARTRFVLKVGQKFATAHTLFEFGKSTTASSCDSASLGMAALDNDLDLLSVTAMMSILVNGGVSFGKIFKLLNSHHGGWLQPITKNLEVAMLEEGEPLSKALSRHPEVFSTIYVAMIELGESTDLGRALDRLYRQLARDHQKRNPGSSDLSESLSLACRNIADVLEGGGSESKALLLAAKVCPNEPIRRALLEIESQLNSSTRLSDCKYPPMFTPLFARLIAAHEVVGSIPIAFRDLAEFLESS